MCQQDFSCRFFHTRHTCEIILRYICVSSRERQQDELMIKRDFRKERHGPSFVDPSVMCGSKFALSELKALTVIN